MAKIYSDELHCNDNASIQFGSAILGAVGNVRRYVSILATSRKADEYAPGAIHVLRKLCDGEPHYLISELHRQEVEEWKTVFFQWFERVKRHFPEEYRDAFRANAEDDFRVILAYSGGKLGDFEWRKEAEERHIKISFKNETALEAARKAADEMYPVRLGSALHQYIDRCIAKLMGDTNQDDGLADAQTDSESPAASPIEQDNAEPSTRPLTFRFLKHPDDCFSLLVEQFDCFDSEEDLSQDIVTKAYDLEDAVKNYLLKNYSEIANTIHFDCESSMFCVRTNQQSSLVVVIEVLLLFATDPLLYLKGKAE